ncbi:MAG: putative DNA-binding domain-containing protein [Pseudomonadota bacterium]|nr:putative DNA-binding domain-containing protein [Pseudomonadota bacterium]
MMPRYTNQLHAFCDGIIKNDGRDVVETIAPPPRGDAAQRFRIYTEGYRIRLQKAVEADYPCLKHYLGERALHVLIADYVEQTLSQHFNLDRYPFAFGEFVGKNSADPIAKEIALLESAISSVFMTEESDPLEPGDLSNLDPEQFGRMMLRPRQASLLLSFTYPVNTYLTAFRADQAPQEPAPAAHYLHVYRHQNHIVRHELLQPAFVLLQHLFCGQTVEEALENTLSQEAKATEFIIANLQSWFQEWTAAGFFATSL